MKIILSPAKKMITGNRKEKEKKEKVTEGEE